MNGEVLALQHMLQKGCLSGTVQESEIHPSNAYVVILILFGN